MEEGNPITISNSGRITALMTYCERLGGEFEFYTQAKSKKNNIFRWRGDKKYQIKLDKTIVETPIHPFLSSIHLSSLFLSTYSLYSKVYNFITSLPKSHLLTLLLSTITCYYLYSYWTHACRDEHSAVFCCFHESHSFFHVWPCWNSLFSTHSSSAWWLYCTIFALLHYLTFPPLHSQKPSHAG